MDDASNDVFQGVRRLDVVEIGRRRRWSDEAKERIVGEAFANGSSVSAASRRNGVDPSQIYDWRRKLFPQISTGARVRACGCGPGAGSVVHAWSDGDRLR